MNNCHAVTVCSSCKNVNTFAKKYSSVLGFVIFILPKCPFCFVAYSSAVTLCGTSTLITHTTRHTDWGAYIALAMGITITSCIFFTNKKKQYRGMALIMALCGMLLLSIGIFKTDAMICYYIGAALLVMATFIYNRVLRATIEKIKNMFPYINNQAIRE